MSDLAEFLASLRYNIIKIRSGDLEILIEVTWPFVVLVLVVGLLYGYKKEVKRLLNAITGFINRMISLKTEWFEARSKQKPDDDDPPVEP